MKNGQAKLFKRNLTILNTANKRVMRRIYINIDSVTQLFGKRIIHEENGNKSRVSAALSWHSNFG